MSHPQKRIMFVCNSPGIAARFRLPIFVEAKRQGYEILCVCGVNVDSADHFAVLDKNDVPWIQVPGLENANLNLLKLISIVKEISRAKREFNPCVVHSFTHKANITSFFSVLFDKLYFIPNVTGAGRIFSRTTENKISAKLVFIKILYYLMRFKLTYIFFQNRHDAVEFRNFMKISSDKVRLTNGSGLDPKLYPKLSMETSKIAKQKFLTSLGYDVDKYIYIMPSRALFAKGVVEFREAAKQFQGLYKDTIFVIAGHDVTDAHVGLSKNYFEQNPMSNFHYIGYRADIMEILNFVDVVVLPSKYREGVPRSLIEGLYFGKYIITTDTPGCCETVVSDENGMLVTTGSIDELVDAMLAAREKISSNNEHSLSLFQKKFSSELIVSEYLKTYRDLDI